MKRSDLRPGYSSVYVYQGNGELWFVVAVLPLGRLTKIEWLITTVHGPVLWSSVLPASETVGLGDGHVGG